ncbi:hypothetical protein ACIHCQ_26830 [Streptomyces sp. NPDC052236]|uniref:hypothetical protein n=1 Tax=Streptomyces sp. NPDC052236 TaxID=3365686 RepID=UPI0037D2EC64
MLNGEEAWSPPNGTDFILTAAGRMWDAVRVPARIGLRVTERLADSSGAVIQDGWGGLLYWLVRPRAADDWGLPKPCVEIRGEGTYVAVPPGWCTQEQWRLRWIVPPTRTCYLTDPELLHAALAAEIDILIGPRSALLPCRPCLGGIVFGGRHDCRGTSSMTVGGRKMPPGPCPCPCMHRQLAQP